ncbi:NAD(P)H-binding protein [Mesorhizobium sp. M0199]|uniref:NAD(P)H-binding protein n=1 Tax=Mesorhizobium sp. M0199 TaxID=2956911 RepID=UPI00333A8E9C
MIVTTAPTGDIGHQVVENVLAGGEPVRVIARDPSALPAHILERVEIVPGSHRDINVVHKAFAGADTVFWLLPPDPHAKTVEAAYVDFTRPACDAIRSQGVKRVVDITALGRGTPVMSLGRSRWTT